MPKKTPVESLYSSNKNKRYSYDIFKLQQRDYIITKEIITFIYLYIHYVVTVTLIND